MCSISSLGIDDLPSFVRDKATSAINNQGVQLVALAGLAAIVKPKNTTSFLGVRMGTAAVAVGFATAATVAASHVPDSICSAVDAAIGNALGQ
jgi:hypothetical protein